MEHDEHVYQLRSLRRRGLATSRTDRLSFNQSRQSSCALQQEADNRRLIEQVVDLILQDSLCVGPPFVLAQMLQQYLAK